MIMNCVKLLSNVAKFKAINRCYCQSNAFRIYTRKGDKGMSYTFTGERRPKDDLIFEALGTTDELSSSLGLVREYALNSNHDEIIDHVTKVQCLLQDVGSAIATPKSSAKPADLERVAFGNHHAIDLEKNIDYFTKYLPPLKNFILPSGGKTSTMLHLSRGICRRAERRVAPLVISGETDPDALKYLNRLSDFLFTLARYAAHQEGQEERIYIKPVEQ